MGTSARKQAKHTFEDWLALPEDSRVELIGGEFIEKAAPDIPHAVAQASTGRVIGIPFHRRPGGRYPGGWWIATEADIRLGGNLFRPDVVGWRRERVPELPVERPCTTRPDWICEILSESNWRNDLTSKLALYHQAGVPHYWVLDPADGTLSVFRNESAGYLHLLTAGREEFVRAEPFDAVELRVGLLLGEDPDD